ncbi:MAG: C10 family peptidase [Bacteroidales bacterium]|jgi:hypothetical protein|nr:C10 family peptidase [Bacteroidales bacterium]
MKKTSLLFVLLFFFISAFSTNITPDEAQRVAHNFLVEKGYEIKNVGEQLFLLPSAEKNGETLLYKFNVDDAGFVIVSGKTTTYPILAYSLSGNFESNPAMDFWIATYEEQLAGATKGSRVWSEVPQQWAHYLAVDFTPRQEKSDIAVEPLLTSQWDQSKYYNTYCPWDIDAGSYYDYRVPNGCVALCMAQIMYYYRFPKTGTGGVSYIPSPYPRQIVVFSDHTYNYDAMTDQLSCYNGEVAKLIYHAGVATKMGYASDGSGAYTETAVQKMINHFKYNSEAKIVYPDEYPNDLAPYYIQILLTELQERRPILYSGYAANASAGHAFILDGIDADSLFHVNWGWGGSGNGYFRITNLDPGGSNFSYSAQGFTKLYPSGTTSPVMSGHDRLIASIGTFSSGNMHLPYAANPNKTWMLAVPHATNYHIKINKLDIDPGADQIIIYNGSTVESGEKAVLNISHIGQTISVTTDSVLIAFKSNGSATMNESYHGFHFSYSTTLTPNPIDESTVLDYQIDHVISPETVDGFYLPQRECSWLMSPTFVNGFSFVIKDFDLRAGDFIDIYNATTSPATLWKRFDIYEPPTEVYTANFSKMKVVFSTDNWLEGSGFNLEYHAILGIDENTELKDIAVYPNPANSQVNVEFYAENSDQITLKLYDVTGKMLDYYTYAHPGGSFTQKVPVNHLTAGLYILHIETSQGKVIRKINVN